MLYIQPAITNNGQQNITGLDFLFDHQTKILAKRKGIDISHNGLASKTFVQGLVDHIDRKGIIIAAITEKYFRHCRLSERELAVMSNGG